MAVPEWLNEATKVWGAQAELSRRTGIESHKINKVLAGTRELSHDEAELLKRAVRDMQAAPVDDEPLPTPNVRPAPFPPKSDHLNRVPLLGSGQAGPDGVFELNNGEPIDYVDRPPGLAGKQMVYTIYVDGDSMDPAYQHGDLVFVDAARKPFPGRDAVIELLPEFDGGPRRAFIKRIVKLTTDYVELFEFKPKERTFRFPRSKIRHLHLVLKNTDMY